MTIDNVLEILEKHKLHIPSNVFYELKADIVNFEEPTTKNDLAVDCISRADAIKAMQDKAKKLSNEDTINGLCGAVAILFDLPSVTPQQPILDKIFCIVHPLSIMSTPELEHKAIMQIAEMLEPLCLPESEE